MRTKAKKMLAGRCMTIPTTTFFQGEEGPRGEPGPEGKPGLPVSSTSAFWLKIGICCKKTN